MKESILQKAKGVRDFGPLEKIKRNQIISKLEKTFTAFGFLPIETPILERYELFASKFAQGEASEAMQETFKLKDQGARDLVLRNEFTVPLARFVGDNPELKMPFKRYQIGQIFRDGPIKLGRYREFWQCDIDIVGVPEVTADAEIISIAQQAFASLGLEVEIYINSRKLLNQILSTYNISEADQASVIISIDKLEKIGRDGVFRETTDNGFDSRAIEQILDLLSVEGNNQEILNQLEQTLGDSEGINDLRRLLDNLISTDGVRVLPSLARGLAYYTGNIFEAKLKDQSILSSSLCGGGRYDQMIAGFIDSKEVIPAVGMGFGLETIFDALNLSNRSIRETTTTDFYLAIMGAENYTAGLNLAARLREVGFNVSVDLQNRKLKKNLEYASDLQIPYILILGSDEVTAGKVTLRNLTTGEQELLTVEEINNKFDNRT